MKHLLSRVLALALLLSFHPGLSPSPARADLPVVSCEHIWSTAYPLPQHPSKHAFCIGLRVGSNYWVYLEEGAVLDDDMLHALDLALARSYAVYSAIGALPKATFVILKTASESKDRSFAFARPKRNLAPNEGCPIFINPKGAHLSADAFQQLIAHEFFHCLAYQEFAEQYFGPPRQGDFDPTSWWMEGTAEFASSVAFPKGQLEAPNATHYDPETPLLEQKDKYSTFMFFNALAQSAGGIAPFKPFILGLPKKGDLTDQRRAVSKIPGAEDAFHLFARQLEMAMVPDWENMSAYSTPEVPVSGEVPVFRASGPVGVTQKSGTIKKWKLLLPAGGKYTFKAPIQPWGRASVREGEGPWQDFPAELETACGPMGEEKELLTTHLNGSPFDMPVSVDMDYEDKKCACKEDAPVDPCLLGRWRLDNQALGQIYDGVENAKFIAASGELSFAFKPDKSFAIDAKDLKLSMEVKAPGQPGESGDWVFFTQFRFHGNIRAKAAVERKSIVCATPVSSDLKLETQVFKNGQEVARDEQVVGDPAGGTSEYFSYACEKNALMIDRMAIVGGKPAKLTLVFQKQ